MHALVAELGHATLRDVLRVWLKVEKDSDLDSAMLKVRTTCVGSSTASCGQDPCVFPLLIS